MTEILSYAFVAAVSAVCSGAAVWLAVSGEGVRLRRRYLEETAENQRLRSLLRREEGRGAVMFEAGKGEHLREAAAHLKALEAENARLREDRDSQQRVAIAAQAEVATLRELLTWFDKNAASLKSDIRSAHYNRGNGCTEWMREEDRDFRREMDNALALTRAALEGK